MADIAAVFGWTPDVMDEMEPPELLRWHVLARERGAVAGGSRG
ncbi:GpE family phage tail protein [Azospirillum sp.]|nr:GpE family phage tail protein [Azospirillum sp.]HYD66993.1 GpE family phage tail protein [Azospirillum sp.]